MLERKRSILICAEDTEGAAAACQWAVREVYREGDVFHLAYVIPSLKPPLEVYHGMPGTSFQFSHPGRHNEEHKIAAAKAAIEARYLPILKGKMVPYELHLYAEHRDVSPERIAEIVLKSAEERDAALLVLAAHNKLSDSDGFNKVGSVAQRITRDCQRPLALIHPN